MSRDILIIDKIHHKILEMIELTYSADYHPEIEYRDLSDIINRYEVLIISTRIEIDKQLLEKASNLKLIIRMGIGIDHIDLQICKKKGIMLCITPSSNISSVVELVFGQILRVYRNLEAANQSVVHNRFRTHFPHGLQLKNKKIGIIGVGRIGSKIAEVSKVFCMDTLGYDPYLTNDEKISRNIDVWFDNIFDMLCECDIVTLHTPLTEQTLNLVDKVFLDAMKDGSILINSSRGKVINFTDLVGYANPNKFKKIILDVYDKEPFNIDKIPHNIIDKFYFSPHIGGYTEESFYDRSIETLEELKDYFNNCQPHGLVDLDKGY